MPFTPYDAASHAIGRAWRLLQASRRSSGLPVTVRADLRRLSVVMAVAALDTYMHRLIVDRAYTHAELPGALARLDVRFVQLLAQADATKMAARREPHHSRPRVAIKRQLRDRLLRETFQRYEDVATALGMAGRPRKWPEIASRLTPAMSSEQVRERLNGIVTRRNQIVHEGDYKRLDRPRQPSRNSLTYSQAKADVEFLAALIDAIHDVV